MKRSWIMLLVVAAAVGAGGQAWAFCGDGYSSPYYSWHGEYYDAAWGMPVALVVPPGSHMQANLSWGVPSSRQTYIRAQFMHGWMGPGYYNPNAFAPTPPWPSDTTQFGVYYVRGPR